MSDYGYDRRGSRRGRPRSPEYVQETTYVQRSYAPQQELVYRGGREDSIEDIPRDFPPPGGHRDSYAHQRSRSVGRNSYDPEAFYYQQQQRGRRDSQYYDRDGYYSDDYERPRNARRKSVVDQITEAGQKLGLGGVIGAVTGKAADRERGRSRSESRPRYDDRARSRSRGDSRDPEQKGMAGKKWEQAAKAAILAGAVEAFRSRKEPGKWTEGKGQRVATAALGAAGLDGFLDKDPNKKEKRHIAQSALGGLVANRIANGPRSKSRDRGDSEDRSRSRSRSRSRARSIFSRDRSQSRGRERSQSRGREGEKEDKDNTVRNVAGAGAALAAGKALYDRMRSKSRSRKERAESVDSEDSYVPSRGRNYRDDRRRSRSRSVGGNRRDRSSSTSTTDYEQQRRKMRGKELLTAGLATVATIHAAHGVYSSMEASEKRRKLVSEGEMTSEEARKRKSKNMLQDAAAIGIAALGIKGAFSEWKEMNEKRHTVKELEDKRKKRQRQREKRQREMRERMGAGPQNQLALNTGSNSMANPYPGYSGGSTYSSMTYADANPYSAVPPPPMGGGMRY